MADDYRFGIEEEYFLADAGTARSPSREVAEAFHRLAGQELDVAEHELLVGQVEVSTEPGTDPNESLAKLTAFRRKLSELATTQDLLLFAAGSHPLAVADDQHVAGTDRYRRLGDELKLIAPKAPVSAMHVHVEVPEGCERVGLTNRLMPFLPLLLALSVSSPFWEGRSSGLQCYRLTAFSQWPRAGLPEWFSSAALYEQFLDRLQSAGFVEDASFVWSHIRPSTHYPTIEMRVCDSCTRVADAVAIAALYRALVRATVRRPDINASFGPVEHALVGANLWRAQQAGIKASFADTTRNRVVPLSEMLEEVLDLVAEDLAELGMTDWTTHLRAIAREGTSADRQLQTFQAVDDRPDDLALKAVVRALAAETNEA